MYLKFILVSRPADLCLSNECVGVYNDLSTFLMMKSDPISLLNASVSSGTGVSPLFPSGTDDL